MKNIMVFDDGQDYFYDVHAVSDEDFARIFAGPDQDVEFHDDLYQRPDIDQLEATFRRMWFNRRGNTQIRGVHGMLFYENWDRKPFYPGKRDIAHTRATLPGPIDPHSKIVMMVNREPGEPIVACAVDADMFQTLFSRPHQDVLFHEDLEDRFGREHAKDITSKLNKNIVAKSEIMGIHGTLYTGYPDQIMYFPDRIDQDIPRHYPLKT